MLLEYLEDADAPIRVILLYDFVRARRGGSRYGDPAAGSI
jgi:hypothetical protein